MAKPVLKKIDPLKIYLHARGFALAQDYLSRADLNTNPQMVTEMGQSVIVISALTSELLFKCIICIETGEVPRGHDLAKLYARVSRNTRAYIQHIWDTEVRPKNEATLARIEAAFGNGEKLKRDLEGALASGSLAFEQIRYSYEPDSDNAQFYLSDLPAMLIHVILWMKPEWARIRRKVSEVPLSDQPPAQPPGSDKQRS